MATPDQDLLVLDDRYKRFAGCRIYRRPRPQPDKRPFVSMFAKILSPKASLRLVLLQTAQQKRNSLPGTEI